MGSVTVMCDKCGVTHKVDASELDIDEVSREERNMGPEIAYGGSLEIDCGCGQTIEITHDYWEYPAGSFSDKETEVKGARVTSNTL